MPNWSEPVELDEDRDPWEQQPGESDEHYALFRMYLKLTPEADTATREVMPRRVSDLFGKTQFSDRHVKRMARHFCWELRAKAKDVADVQSVQGRLEHHWLVLVKNRLDQLDKADKMVFKALEATLDDMLNNPSSYKLRDIVAFWEVSVKVGNGILGMTRLGGPDQASLSQAVAAAAKAEVTVNSADSLDARTMELAAELQRRAEIAAGGQESSA